MECMKGTDIEGELEVMRKHIQIAFDLYLNISKRGETDGAFSRI